MNSFAYAERFAGGMTQRGQRLGEYRSPKAIKSHFNVAFEGMNARPWMAELEGAPWMDARQRLG